MGIISTSPEPEKTWHAARWAYRRLVEDALLLHGQDPELGPLFEQAIAVDGLSFQMEEDFLAERGMVALIDTAKRTLTSASRDSLRWHVGLDENVQRAYLAAITDLLDLLEQEHGRERVGIVSISEDKNWVVARWIFSASSRRRETSLRQQRELGVRPGYGYFSTRAVLTWLAGGLGERGVGSHFPDGAGDAKTFAAGYAPMASGTCRA